MVRVKRRRSRSSREWATILWAAFVALFFLWQTVAYRGVVAFVAEWQFNEFGLYRPALTYLVLVALLAPLPLLFRRRRARSGDGKAHELIEVGYTAALRHATRLLKAMAWLAGIAFAAALLTLLATLTLPSDAGPMQRITASDTLTADPQEGPTELSGKILFNRTSAFDENLWLIRRNVRFAPVIEEGADENAIRYFVELAPTDQAVVPASSVRKGILKRNALPGELVRLYRYAGFRVFADHYVLFSSPAPMRWPYFVLAGQLAMAGLLFLLVAAIQWVRRRRLIAQSNAQQENG